MMLEAVIVYFAKPFVYRLMASIQSAYEIGISHVLQSDRNKRNHQQGKDADGHDIDHQDTSRQQLGKGKELLILHYDSIVTNR